MKKFAILLALALVTTLSANADMLMGIIYNNATTPGDGYTAAAATKQGTAVCKNFFYLIGTGDCSVRSAMKNGNIKSLAGYDVQRENVLGFQTITVKAWGN